MKSDPLVQIDRSITACVDALYEVADDALVLLTDCWEQFSIAKMDDGGTIVSRNDGALSVLAEVRATLTKFGRMDENGMVL